MKHRLAPLARAMQFHGLERSGSRRQGVESLLRTCQLLLMFWLAFHGAQFAAKGVVQAGALLAGWLR